MSGTPDEVLNSMESGQIDLEFIDNDSDAQRFDQVMLICN